MRPVLLLALAAAAAASAIPAGGASRSVVDPLSPAAAAAAAAAADVTRPRPHPSVPPSPEPAPPPPLPTGKPDEFNPQIKWPNKESWWVTNSAVHVIGIGADLPAGSGPAVFDTTYHLTVVLTHPDKSVLPVDVPIAAQVDAPGQPVPLTGLPAWIVWNTTGLLKDIAPAKGYRLRASGVGEVFLSVPFEIKHAFSPIAFPPAGDWRPEPGAPEYEQELPPPPRVPSTWLVLLIFGGCGLASAAVLVALRTLVRDKDGERALLLTMEQDEE